jgi:hypothetical protein
MAASRDPRALVDLARHPIDPREGPAYAARVEDCRAQLDGVGYCELEGFLRPEATAALAAEASRLAPLAHHHTGAATPYLEVPSPGWPPGHPRLTFRPYALGAVAFDHIPATSPLRSLYLWDGLLGFLADCLGEARLYRYADPLGACNVAVMGDGDELEWHFDQTDFVVSLALQDADEGGDFLVAPRIRSATDERYGDVAAVLAGDGARVRRLGMNPGTLLLFQGRHSLHCVSRVRGGTPRLVALLAYDTRPGTCASPLLQQARYGRVQQPA